jgi:hypothetical protein
MNWSVVVVVVQGIKGTTFRMMKTARRTWKYYFKDSFWKGVDGVQGIVK